MKIRKSWKEAKQAAPLIKQRVRFSATGEGAIAGPKITFSTDVRAEIKKIVREIVREEIFKQNSGARRAVSKAINLP